MVYTLSYSNIHESDLSSVGKRALFMSKIITKHLVSGIFFVINNDAFREFYSHNSLKNKFEELLSLNSEDELWDSLKELFSVCSFPDNVKKEIRESYDALSISGDNASNILRSFDARVNIFISSENKGLDGVFLNIKGFDNILSAIKSCWFNHFKKLGVKSLINDTIFDLGIIIEKFVSADYSVEVEVTGEESNNLLISVYKGLPEVSPGIVKDLYVLSYNHLEFINYDLNHQNFCIIHQEESGVLLKKRMGREGGDNKVSKSLVSECGRLAKRIFDVLDEFVKVIFIIKKDVPHLFFVDQFSSEDLEVKSKSIELEETVNVVSSIDSDDNESFEHSFVESSSIESEPILEQTSEYFNKDKNVVDEKKDVFVDSDEFIVQGEKEMSSEEDSYSSFFKLIELLEEDIVKLYKGSFGFSPSSFEEAIDELDSKHGFEEKEKIYRVLEVKNLLVSGEEVDEDIISSLNGVIEDFLRKVDD